MQYPTLLVAMAAAMTLATAGTQAAATAPGTASVQGVQVQLKYNNPTPGYSSILSLDDPSGTFYLGLYNLSVDAQPYGNPYAADQSFNAFCIDPFQHASTNWATYDAVAFSTLSANPNYNNVLKLYDNAYGNLFSNTGNLTAGQYATAFHLALWEIWKGNYNLESNPVNVAGGVDTPVELKSKAFLDSLNGWSVIGTYNPNQMMAFLNADQQDFLALGVYVIPVPEVDTYAFLGLGMGLVGLLTRRRKA